MNKKKGLLLQMTLLLGLALIIPGCWDVHDISDRSLVTAMAIDLAANDPDTYRVTYEIINPIGYKKQNDDKSRILETVEGKTLTQALERLQARVAHLVYLGHLRMVLVGENAARQNFQNIIDFVERNPQMSLRFRLRYVRGEALDALRVEPLFEKYLGDELTSLPVFRRTIQYSLVRGIRYVDFITDLYKSDGRGLGTAISIDPDRSGFIQEGGAIYSHWALKDFLNGTETQAANWFLGGGSADIVADYHGATVTYVVDNKKNRLVPWINDGQLQFQVNIRTDGQILEVKNGDLLVSDESTRKELEAQLKEVIAAQARSAVEKAQKQTGVDYLGFDRALLYKYPQLYRSLDWYEVFPNVPVNVEVQVNITRFGLGV